MTGATNTASIVEHVLRMVDRGHAVMPLNEDGKDPKGIVGRWGPGLEWPTRDPEKIREHWRQYPHHNYAVVADKTDLLVDIDCKGERNGYAALERLDAAGYELNAQFRVRTPSGGRHDYFTTPTPLRGTKDDEKLLGKGVETKCNFSGYLVGPGSVVDGKRYEIIDDGPTGPAPDWFIDRCRKARERTRAAGHVACLAGTDEPLAVDTEGALRRAREYLAHVDPAIEGEGGDGHTVQVAEHVGDFGISEARCLDIMAEIFDPRCSPPWGPEGLAQKVRNAYSYREKPIGCAHPAAEFCRVRSDDGPKKRERFKRYTFSDLKSLPPAKWLVHNLIPENALALVYGPPKVGKTFWVLDASLCVASGQDFHGHAVRRGRVLYIAGEGSPARLRDRVAAWMLARSVSEAEIGNWDLLPERVDISDAATVRALVESLGAPRYDMIVIDTVNRCMSGDENSQADMSQFVAGCDYLRAETGAAVVPIHHEGKDPTRGSRGSTVLRGAIDTGIRVRPQGAGILVEVEDQKDAEAAAPSLFELKSVSIGADTSAHLVSLTFAEARRSAPLKPGRTKDAYDVLVTLAEAEGVQPPSGAFPGTKAVHVDGWRDNFCREMATKHGVARKSAQTTFRRACDTLATMGKVEITHEFAWVSDGDNLATFGDMSPPVTATTATPP